jgi:hypothetical protein
LIPFENAPNNSMAEVIDSREEVTACRKDFLEAASLAGMIMAQLVILYPVFVLSSDCGSEMMY